MAVGRVAALDMGKARIGVAVTDPLGYTVQPLITIWRKGRGGDRRNLLRLFRKHGVTEVVVGKPLHMSGEAGPWAREVEAFSEELHRHSGLPVHLWDERLTSVAAHDLLDEAGYKRSAQERRDRKPLLDQMAAVVILESWLQERQYAQAREQWTEGVVDEQEGSIHLRPNSKS